MKRPGPTLAGIALGASVFVFSFFLGDWNDRVAVTVRDREAPQGAVPEADAGPAGQSTAAGVGPDMQALTPLGAGDQFRQHARQGQLLEERVHPGAPDGNWKREQLWRINSKYPLARVTETVQSKSGILGQVVGEQRVAVGDHVIVGLKEGVDESVLADWVGRKGYFIQKEIEEDRVYLVGVNGSALDSLPLLLQELSAQDGLVEYAEPDGMVYGCAVPNDARFGELWGLNNTGQTGGLADADVDGPEAWDVRNSASSVVVAVIDSGVRYTHQDLAGNMWNNPGETGGVPGFDDDGNGFIDDFHGYDFWGNQDDANSTITEDNDPMDEHGHGTHVAGTIGAVGNNGVGVAGVAWDVQIMAVRFIGPDNYGYDSDATQAINYATASGAQITNNSWGGPGEPPISMSNAILAARNKNTPATNTYGIIFVAAAGNSGKNNDGGTFYPAAYTLDPELTNVIAVAATDDTDELASFSNFGVASVDLAAPGVDILSCGIASNSAYVAFQGTSMAAPHVAGALALVKEHFPGETHETHINRVVNNTDVLPSLDGRVFTSGRLNLNRIFQGPPGGNLGKGNDFDRDGRSDAVLFSPSAREWVVIHSSSGREVTTQWGGAGSRPVAGDYDGDGRTDYAVYYPSFGLWAILASRLGEQLEYHFGGPKSVPCPGDYDGDGKTDKAIYEQASGVWRVWFSSNGQIKTYTLGSGVSQPVCADYDGDGIADLGVYDARTGRWSIYSPSTDKQQILLHLGPAGSVPVPGDYDGDGMADTAFYHAGSRQWTVEGTTDGSMTRTVGAKSGRPVPADYNGDGMTDAAVHYVTGSFIKEGVIEGVTGFFSLSPGNSTYKLGYGGYDPVMPSP